MCTFRRYAQAFAFSCALAGCQTTQPRVETITVKVPVVTPCLKPEQIPARPVKPAMPQDQQAALAVAMGWLLQWDAWGVEADGLLRACSAVN